jgi:Lrp/AsnC family leucine-responsive transcriptional regulator
MKKSNVEQLDRIDRAILRNLQRDGRLANTELANAVNLTPSPCHDRVKRLETLGFIESYRAVLNAKKLNAATIAFVEITLDRVNQKVFEQFRDKVSTLRDVADCYMVAGNFDYLVKLRIASMNEYRDALARLADLPHVANTNTYVVIENVKTDNGIYIPE